MDIFFQLIVLLFLIIYFAKIILPLLANVQLFVERYCVRNKQPKIEKKFSEPQLVTVQIPIYNDGHVGARCINSLIEVNYPKEKLYIQVLDDSTEEESSRIVQNCVSEIKSKGFDIEYITRGDRIAFKAGNLSNGLKTAKGDIVAIFDSDSIVPKDFFTKLIDYFTDPNIAFVQGRKIAINENENMITKVDAINIDAEHVIQQTGKNWNGYFITFNGSGGMWRISVIEKLGGWTGESLAEDRDLSYRAFINGYRAIYNPSVITQEEVPSTIDGQQSQKSRWFSGTSKTARDYFFKIINSKLSIGQKLDAIFQMVIHFFGVMNPIFDIIGLYILVATTYGYFPMVKFASNIYLIYGLWILVFFMNFMYLYAGQQLSGKKITTMGAIKYTLFSNEFWGDLVTYYNFIFNKSKGDKKSTFAVTPKSGFKDAEDQNLESKVKDFKFAFYPVLFYLELILLGLMIYNPASRYLIPLYLIDLPYLSFYLTYEKYLKKV